MPIIDSETGTAGLSRRQAAKLDTQRRLLRAVREMTALGDEISVAAAARRAGIGVATAYRYYSDVDSLRSDAALELRMDETGPDFLESYRRKVARVIDPEERLVIAQRQMVDYVAANELNYRMFSAKAQERHASTLARGEHPLPQRGRRLVMIEEALAPVRAEWSDKAWRQLVTGLLQATGPEPWLALRDDLGLSEKDANRANEQAVRDIYRANLQRRINA